MSDLKARPYARTAVVRVGTFLIPDGGFNCMKEGRSRRVCENATGLYIHCRTGKHYLDGQLSDDGTHFIGLYQDDDRR